MTDNLLSRFQIQGLYNRRNIDVIIEENKLVLVGENGTGKSTVANIITFFLTCQWKKLLNYEFDRIVAQLGNQEIVLERNLISNDSALSFRHLPPRRRREIMDIFSYLASENSDILHNHEKQIDFARQMGIPRSMLSEYIDLYQSEPLDQPEKLREIRQTILSKMKGQQILYLPTYRRIEQDLQSILPGLDLEKHRHAIARKMERQTNSSAFIELVEFGMEDVELLIQKRLYAIKDSVREGLSNLTGSYLRDVIKGEYRSVDLTTKLREIDETTISIILNRIPEGILPTNERTRLQQIIQKVKDAGTIDEEDKVIAHFLSQLIDLYKVQQEQEQDMRNFVEVGNRYLSEKKLVYDNANFKLVIRDEESPTRPELELKMLSSGEKQILSLFSHIYLSGQEKFFVVIDEPELSLSVPWQKRFLPDILATGKCTGLIAVTHSPFIFDNELEDYTHSLEEFVELVNVVP